MDFSPILELEVQGKTLTSKYYVLISEIAAVVEGPNNELGYCFILLKGDKTELWIRREDVPKIVEAVKLYNTPVLFASK